MVHADFTITGMTVKPAAEGLVPKTGHFHLLIDEPASPPEGEVIPFDATHLHYGKGQTSVDFSLPEACSVLLACRSCACGLQSHTPLR
jgi:hypothetical protein